MTGAHGVGPFDFKIAVGALKAISILIHLELKPSCEFMRILSGLVYKLFRQDCF